MQNFQEGTRDGSSDFLIQELFKKINELQENLKPKNTVSDNEREISKPRTLKKSKMNFQEWIDIFLEKYNSKNKQHTLDYKKWQLQKFLSFTGNKDIHEYDEYDLEEFVKTLEPFSKSTINSYRVTLKKFFTSAMSEGYADFDPTSKIIWPVGDIKFRRFNLTPHEIQKVLISCGRYEGALGNYFSTLLFTGLRPSELQNAKLEDFDFDKNIIFVRKGKTKNAERMVPLCRQAKTFLVPVADRMRKLIDIDPHTYKDQPIFRSETDKPITKSIYRKEWQKLKNYIQTHFHQQSVERFNVISPYWFRHTFCTACKDTDMGEIVQKEIMGHSTYNHALDYAHQTSFSIEKARRCLEDYWDKTLIR